MYNNVKRQEAILTTQWLADIFRVVVGLINMVWAGGTQSVGGAAKSILSILAIFSPIPMTKAQKPCF